ncbi:thiolase family protein [Novosphingobium mangrovi (ex Huang et al. 2023)]|uniref:Thiolase family protein n=1 Tax=Novosphingobium mangrovi (ex Huang et al. 2023) TaxID=2976432 RepID=A0ABT2I4S5_9SPHN|nr:thiolase family protein [Novosphingobium mangrovi (ex Huang et al. 2023)]MCT2399790.1 thiolase family protein [Novosphingobium mangrovi (ex Huang et al. 2023)]
MTLHPEKLTCITSAAQSEVGRPSSRTALQLTADACLAAIADAGLEVSDIDGIACYPGKSAEGGGIAPVSPSEAAAVLGIDPNWTLASAEGFSHMAPIFNAITAIACGLARHVVVFRSVAQATARMASRSSTLMSGSRNRVEGNNAWTVPFNALSPINTFALYAQAYFEKYGANEEQLGMIAVNNRRNAAHNENAVYRKPLSLDDYLASRVISTPLRLLDCDSHIDGSTAIVVSHRDAAKDLKNPPLHIESMGMAVGGLWVGRYEGDFTSMPAAHKAGEMLWSRTDLKPADMDCAQIYDGFSIHVWMWMEALGLVPRGEACRFVEGGKRIALDGELPLNTGGGQLSAGRFHGYGHIHEATVQLWHRGGGRQVEDAKTCIISNGGYGYGAMILRRD